MDFDFATRCCLRVAVTASQFMCLGCAADARASRDGYNSVRYCQWTMLDSVLPRLLCSKYVFPVSVVDNTSALIDGCSLRVPGSVRVQE